MDTMRRYRQVLVLVLAIAMALIAPLGASAAPVIEDDPGSPAQLSTIGLAYRLVDSVFNGGDTDAAAALVSEGAVIHTVSGDYVGPAGLLDYIAQIERNYPDASFEVTSISISDSGLTMEWLMTATRFQFDPAEPALDVNVAIPSAATITIADGQIAEMSQAEDGMAVEPAGDTAASSQSARAPEEIAMSYGPNPLP